MNEAIKNSIKFTLKFLRLDLTKNLSYDRLTEYILKQHLTTGSHCIDIGCHKGEILDIMLKYAPKGKHIGFEPLPHLYEQLKTKYSNNCEIYPYALSDTDGFSSFQYVKNAPAYSGIRKRDYDNKDVEIQEIKVTLKRLDDIMPIRNKIDVIKIDVEGAEYNVLKGGAELIKQHQPLIIFEYGKGASDYYDASTLDMFDLINVQLGLSIYTLKAFVKNGASLDKSHFLTHFNKNDEYYFVAAPTKK